MKTLILNGSPRPQGDTVALIQAFREGLKGEIWQIDAYRMNVSPCVDCRACMRGGGCRIQDDMEQIYQAAAEADVLAIASPLYFSTLTGPLLSLCSRFQALYAARRRGIVLPGPEKAGVALLVGTPPLSFCGSWALRFGGRPSACAPTSCPPPKTKPRWPKPGKWLEGSAAFAANKRGRIGNKGIIFFTIVSDRDGLEIAR